MQIVDMNLPVGAFRTVVGQSHRLIGSSSLTLVAAFNCIAAALLLSIGATYFSITIPFLMAAIYVLQKFYLRTSRQLRLLDLEAKSPLLSHFTETAEGLVTIRSFGWQSLSQERASQLLNDSQKPYYLLFCIQRWLNLVMGLFTAAVAVLLVAFGLSFQKQSSSGGLGVGLVTILGLNEQVTLLVLAWTALETSLGAIVRLKAFESETPVEDNSALLDKNGHRQPITTSTSTTEHWPQSGKIEIEKINVSYGFVITSRYI